MSLYLVTGGAGFIGSHIVRELLKRGESVRVLDDFSTGRRENLQGLEGALEMIEGDLAQGEICRLALEGVDYVLHQGALPSVPRSIADPLASHRANATGTLSVLAAANERGVKAFVYGSSSSVYGDSPVLPKLETMPPRPLSPYSVSKLTGEEYCRVFHHIYGLPTISLRYFNVFGPRQDPASPYAAVIPKFISAMLKGERPVICGDGQQSRDFTYVSNVVEANLLACQCEAGMGRVFNVGCGEQCTILSLVEILNDVLGTRMEPVHGPPRPGDVRHSRASIEAISTVLGYRVEVDFRGGLERTAEWFRKCGV